MTDRLDAIREAAREAVEALGTFEVFTASDGEAALRGRSERELADAASDVWQAAYAELEASERRLRDALEQHKRAVETAIAETLAWGEDALPADRALFAVADALGLTRIVREDAS